MALSSIKPFQNSTITRFPIDNLAEHSLDNAFNALTIALLHFRSPPTLSTLKGKVPKRIVTIQHTSLSNVLSQPRGNEVKGLIGVLGGMGPAATADLFNKFITFSNARSDQQHIPLLISSIPDIPDRTAALMQSGRSPLPEMCDYLQRLEQAGAECIVIPCNTAHFWFKELRQSCHVELLNIGEATMEEVCASGQQKIGLLATDATLYMGLYQQAIEARGLCCIRPDKPGQEQVMASIYALKAGDAARARAMMEQQAAALFARGAQLIVLGCTEVPVILAEAMKAQPSRYIESTGALVRAGIRWYEQRVGSDRLLTQ